MSKCLSSGGKWSKGSHLYLGQCSEEVKSDSVPVKIPSHTHSAPEVMGGGLTVCCAEEEPAVTFLWVLIRLMIQTLHRTTGNPDTTSDRTPLNALRHGDFCSTGWSSRSPPAAARSAVLVDKRLHKKANYVSV